MSNNFTDPQSFANTLTNKDLAEAVKEVKKSLMFPMSDENLQNFSGLLKALREEKDRRLSQLDKKLNTLEKTLGFPMLSKEQIRELSNTRQNLLSEMDLLKSSK